jgi:hypothetical protein
VTGSDAGCRQPSAQSYGPGWLWEWPLRLPCCLLSGGGRSLHDEGHNCVTLMPSSGQLLQAVCTSACVTRRFFSLLWTRSDLARLQGQKNCDSA